MSCIHFHYFQIIARKRSAAGQGGPLYITMSQFHHHQRSPWELISAWGGLSPQLLPPYWSLSCADKGASTILQGSSGWDETSIDRQYDLSSLPPSNIILLHPMDHNAISCPVLCVVLVIGHWLKDIYSCVLEGPPVVKEKEEQEDVIH